jgi:hypothetical protein
MGEIVDKPFTIIDLADASEQVVSCLKRSVPQKHVSPVRTARPAFITDSLRKLPSDSEAFVPFPSTIAFRNYSGRVR